MTQHDGLLMLAHKSIVVYQRLPTFRCATMEAKPRFQIHCFSVVGMKIEYGGVGDGMGPLFFTLIISSLLDNRAMAR